MELSSRLHLSAHVLTSECSFEPKKLHHEDVGRKLANWSTCKSSLRVAWPRLSKHGCSGIHIGKLGFWGGEGKVSFSCRPVKLLLLPWPSAGTAGHSAVRPCKTGWLSCTPSFDFSGKWKSFEYECIVRLL